MSIFKTWMSSRSQETQSEASIRAAARKLVESGKITLEEARRAAEQIHSFSTQEPAMRKRGIEIFKELADRAGVNRKGFSYDSFNLCSADAIFADELARLVIEFNNEHTLSTMSKEQLTEKMNAIAEELNKHVEEMNRRFPSPKPVAAAKSSEPNMADVDTKSAADWKRNLCDCQSHWPSFAAYAANMRYEAKHPEGPPPS